MGKVTKRKSLVKKLDDIFSLYIRTRDKFTSVTSGKREDVMDCSHVFSRKNYSTRWDEENAFCQTKGENIRNNEYIWPYYKWYQDKYGMKQFEALEKRYNTVKQFKNYELIELAQEYKMKLMELEVEDIL